jgi:predicted restriction endonuclease
MTFAKLLVASHIVPWAEDSANRLNPRNGLCLNALHDRAFDRHLMWVDEQFRVHFAEILHRQRSKHDAALDWLVSYEDKPLQLPKHFSPDPEFLRRHAAECVA